MKKVKFLQKEFSESMAYKRQLEGWTKKEAAKFLGIEYSTYYRIENGKHPSLLNAAKISQWIGEPLTKFLTNQPSPR